MASGRCERVLSGKRKILRTCLGIWRGVRCRSLDPRNQKEISGIRINLTGFFGGTNINASPWYSLRIASKVAVTAENALPIIGIGNDQDIGLLVPGAGNDPGFCLARIIGGAQVRIAN